MSPEIESIVSAIKSLNQESSYFKDYLFPIASAFFSSILGATISYFVLRHQEYIQIEKEKMNSANKWTLIAEQAFSNLVAIKGNYHGRLTSVPFQRFATVPIILFHAKPIDENYQDLSFIVPKAKDSKSSRNKWRSIPRIRAMTSNYNYLIKLWEQRNTYCDPVKLKLVTHKLNKSYTDLTQDDAVSIIGASTLSNSIDFTERVLKLTDDI